MAKKPKQPDTGVPAGLSEAAQAWWRQLQADYPLTDSAGRLLLETALRAFDRAEEARAILDAEGSVVKDRFGQSQPHPAFRVERDARAQMISALRQLHLDVEPARPPGRPSGH